VKIGIVGAGISGLATAHAILQRDPGVSLTIFESGSRVGGKVLTEKTAEGYLCEWGVNAFLDKSPPTLELSKALGLDVLPADASARKRFVYSEGELHKLPEKPPAFLTSRLLSPAGRLRVIGEIFTGRAKKADETLQEFGTRHLGKEAFEKLIDPMASGVFAGDATKMSVKSCFPRIREVEDEYGSLIRGLVSLQRAARKAGSKNTPGPGPGGNLTSFENGMADMTDALAHSLGSRVRLNCPVQSIGRSEGQFTVCAEGGTEEPFDHVVLASPAWAQASMLAELAPDLSKLVGGIEYPSLAVVCLGYRRRDVPGTMDGFGFLVPSREKRDILGTVADSYVFPNRAPEDQVLLRTMVGGARAPELARLPDEQLLDAVRSNLNVIMGINADPVFAKIYRHDRAIPQYRVGHGERLQVIGERLGDFPGLVLTGNAFRGVSLNDCVVNALATAASIMKTEDA
jgi:oxygen-dependent protoporphyrinogen oxidase